MSAINPASNHQIPVHHSGKERPPGRQGVRPPLGFLDPLHLTPREGMNVFPGGCVSPRQRSSVSTANLPAPAAKVDELMQAFSKS